MAAFDLARFRSEIPAAPLQGVGPSVDEAGEPLSGVLDEALEAGELSASADGAGLDQEGVNSARAEASNREARRSEARHDHALIERAKRGESQAFRELVERHQRRALTLALALVRDEQDAREVVQEAFLRVHRGLESFQGSSSFFTWLYRIVTNLSIDLMRRPARRETEVEAYLDHVDEQDIPFLSRIDGADPFDAVRRQEIAKRIERGLAELPPYHRGVIVMREVHGMTYEEMAEAMGVSKGTIMSRLFHARP
ncbi:MAG TPA: sigma-70 family RNA polymerase sigma factor [Polyangiaceae bacterium]